MDQAAIITAVKGVGEGVVSELKDFLDNHALPADVQAVALETAAGAASAGVTYAAAKVAQDPALVAVAERELHRFEVAADGLVAVEALIGLTEEEKIKRQAVSGFLNIVIGLAPKLLALALAA